MREGQVISHIKGEKNKLIQYIKIIILTLNFTANMKEADQNTFLSLKIYQNRAVPTT